MLLDQLLDAFLEGNQAASGRPWGGGGGGGVLGISLPWVLVCWGQWDVCVSPTV